MNKDTKQLIFNKVLTFIRKQGLGERRMYCSKTDRLCSLGYLYSEVRGIDSLKKAYKSIYSFPEQEIEMTLLAYYKVKDIENPRANIISSLRQIHDWSTETKSTETFESMMKGLAEFHDIEYNKPCEVINIGSYLTSNHNQEKGRQVA